jgi:hypothetical protein
MSIINEALKKAGEHLQKKSAQNNSLPPKSARPKPLLAYILILSAGLLLANFIFNYLTRKVKTVGAVASSQNRKTQIIQTLEPVPAIALPKPTTEEKKPQENIFALNGIFFSDNDSYALINNQIVKKDDYIDGAKVSLITAKTVELDKAGVTITLLLQ